jgi:hypothetical protein
MIVAWAHVRKAIPLRRSFPGSGNPSC